MTWPTALATDQLAIIRRRRAILAIILVALAVCRSSASFKPAILNCGAATTLDQLSDCLLPQIPQATSEAFVEPTAAERADWKIAAAAMLDGTCGPDLPPAIRGIAERRRFLDRRDGRVYCVLMEVLDANRDGYVDRGWATFVVNPAASRELHHQVAHPGSDAETDDQALEIFRATNSRSCLLAGAHRWANRAVSACQPAFNRADAAHNDLTIFHATNEVLAERANAGTVIQWHGMAVRDCAQVDVYLSHGLDVTPAPTDPIARLATRLATDHPAWRVGVPGGGACTLNGTTNLQGRRLNGIAAEEICDANAASYTGRFIQIEQDPAFRDPADWVAAIAAVW